MKSLLDTDFSDYYDQELYLPDYTPALVLKRRKDTELPIVKQIEVLSCAGFKTLNKGKFLSVFNILKLKHHKDPKWTHKLHVVTQDNSIVSVFDFIKSRRSTQEPVAEFHLNQSKKYDFFRYIQVGPNHFWIHVTKYKHKIFKNPPLPLKHITCINKPLFSIDFHMTDSGFVATGLSDAPLLKGTGIERYLTPVEAANLITFGLETNGNGNPVFSIV